MTEKLSKPINGELLNSMPTHLRLFAGNPECVSNKLFTATLLEHLSDSNIHSVFIERNFSYPVALQLIGSALRKPPGIAVFEWVDDIRYMAPLIALLDHGFTVWVGLDAADENQARQLFGQLLLFSQSEITQPTNAALNPVHSQNSPTLSLLLQGELAVEVVAGKPA